MALTITLLNPSSSTAANLTSQLTSPSQLRQQSLTINSGNGLGTTLSTNIGSSVPCLVTNSGGNILLPKTTTTKSQKTKQTTSQKSSLSRSVVKADTKELKQNRLPHCSIEHKLKDDISNGKEPLEISIVNGVDDEPVPDDYLYITENCETEPINIDRTITSLQSCRCGDECSSMFCICNTISIRNWYDDKKCLIPEFNFNDPPMIFECNRGCECNYKKCKNRVVSKKSDCRLQVYRSPKNQGWSVRTLKDILRGTFVCEYVGELITDQEAEQREDDSYLFDLDHRDEQILYCLDAKKYGNVARFINHICEPNLTPVKVFVDHQDLSFPRMALFANRDIHAYEELGFDYGEKFWMVKWKDFTCECGTASCKYSDVTIQGTLRDYYRRVQLESYGQDGGHEDHEDNEEDMTSDGYVSNCPSSMSCSSPELNSKGNGSGGHR